MAHSVFQLTLSAVIAVSGLCAQDLTYLSSSCIKVQPGKAQEYRTFVTDYALKANAHLVSTGRATSFSVLRAVIPQGEEARCDYMTVTTYTGSPAMPLAVGEQEKILQAAGLKMSWTDYVAKRTALSKLVATELWATRERVGSYDKGDYMYLNRMQVHNQADYRKFEHDVWRPVAEVMIKDGLMKSWSFHTLVLPSGTDVRITAVTADVIGSWEAVFKQNSLADCWKKAHPGKDLDKTMEDVSKLRDLARRDLYVVQERVTSTPAKISQVK
jgi:hypothetical protein